jgi:hypothetical protein
MTPLTRAPAHAGARVSFARPQDRVAAAGRPVRGRGGRLVGRLVGRRAAAAPGFRWRRRLFQAALGRLGCWVPRQMPQWVL